MKNSNENLIFFLLFFFRKTTNEEAYAVHRKGPPTLSSVCDDKTLLRAEAAGRPSNWEDHKRSSYAGRRSRRNSITTAEDSQLTIENFGGSQVRKNLVHETLLKKIEAIRVRLGNYLLILIKSFRFSLCLFLRFIFNFLLYIFILKKKKIL